MRVLGGEKIFWVQNVFEKFGGVRKLLGFSSYPPALIKNGRPLI